MKSGYILALIIAVLDACKFFSINAIIFLLYCEYDNKYADLFTLYYNYYFICSYIHVYILFWP